MVGGADSAKDLTYMAQALHLAELGRNSTDPNPRVGCVLVKDERVIATGWHRRAGEPHAEVLALRACATDPVGATCYVTLEPCCHTGRTPPCTSALIAAGVQRVVIAMPDPNPAVFGKGIVALKAAGIQVDTGVLADDAQALNAGFSKRHAQGIPFIRVKLGLSLDGRTAMASGESQWITNVPARQDVQHWRARSSAILTGIGTVLHDDPALIVRGHGDDADVRQPVRVVIDSRLRMPENATMLNLPGKTWIFTLLSNTKRPRSWPAEVEVVGLPEADGRVDLHAAMRELGHRHINELWVEAGPTLSGSMLRSGLLDELILYQAPTLLGHEAKAAFVLPDLYALADRVRLQFVDIRRVGPDVRLTVRPERGVATCLQV